MSEVYKHRVILTGNRNGPEIGHYINRVDGREIPEYFSDICENCAQMNNFVSGMLARPQIQIDSSLTVECDAGNGSAEIVGYIYNEQLGSQEQIQYGYHILCPLTRRADTVSGG